MRRQGFKVPLVISGLFLGAWMASMGAVFFQAPFFGNIFPEGLNSFSRQAMERLNREKQPDIPVAVLPLEGHWLRTEQDKGYVPASLIIRKDRGRFSGGRQKVLSLEEARTALNRKTNSLNVMYIWTDDEELKVISVTSFNKDTKKAAIVVVPLHTAVNNGNRVVLGERYLTVRDLYREKGREGVRAFLEKRLDLKIVNYVHVNQAALRKLSNIIGPIEVNGDRTTMLESFEQTAAGVRTDDRDVVRAVASQVLQPRMLKEVPTLIGIFTREIRTNFTNTEMIRVFHLSRQMDLKQMCKTALPGREHSAGDLRYLFISDQTWKNIIYEITQ